jgi:molybdopterin/thiamine biosynthesis adenylyltransferase
LKLENDERFARFGLIEWWQQSRVAAAKVVVVGAGALGNEVIKNLALLGIGRMVILDLDHVETSNLSRSVLFRAADAGQPKAPAAAAAARAIYPDTRARGLNKDVVHAIGAGLFRWADVVIGALDNREARLSVNRSCYRVGTTWIDGAIEALSGVARVFSPPQGACYECSMSALDWQLLEQRHSCSLLNRELVKVGHVPTTPTTAAVVAGIQCQEAMKVLHGKPSSLSGKGFVFDGVEHQSYGVTYTRNPDCMSHEPLGRIVESGQGAATTTAREALGWVREAMGPRAKLTFLREQLLSLDCPQCGRSDRIHRALSEVGEGDAICPSCAARRFPQLFHAIDGSEDFLDLTLAQLGVPPFDIVVGSAGEESIGFELNRDRDQVLGAAGEQS